MNHISLIVYYISLLAQMSARAIRLQERAQRRMQQRAAANVHRIGIGANKGNTNHGNVSILFCN